MNRTINDPFNCSEKLLAILQDCKQGSFILLNAGSKVSDLEGISAAGVDPAARRLTPALDAEALILGKTISAAKLPVSPRGIVSPVVISRACLRLLDLDVKVVDCGSFHAPRVELLRLSDKPADCPSTGRALPVELVYALYKKGLELGANYTHYSSYLLLAECVPGGTTTAYGLLTGLGYEVGGLLSGSLPDCNHELKRELVVKGLKNSPYSIAQMKEEALLAVASLGDPMQAVAAGICMAASAKIPVVLAGGSQMLAVWALIKALSGAENQAASFENICIMTTGWVANDRAARVAHLAEILDAPLFAACPDFKKSKHPGLQAYEEGNVKEGAGAGACLFMAALKRHSPDKIMSEIDKCYDELLPAEN